MLPDNPTRDQIEAVFANDRFATQAAGCRVVEGERGRAVCEMELADIHKNAMGNVMGGAIFTLGGVVESTGGATFLANLFMNSGVTNLGFFGSIAVLMTLVYILHTLCPIGAAILAIFIPIMITLCASFGVSPAVPTIALAIVVAGNVLLPVNPTVMLTYGEGYYTFGDMFKTGVVPAIILIILITFWIPFIVGVLGI